MAVTVAGLATILDVVAEGAPATKLTVVVSCALPSVAVMVSFCTTVEASVVVNTPLALVVPETAPNVLLDPLADSVTVVPAMGLPLASFTVTVSVVVEVPSAVTVAELAAMLDIVAAGASLELAEKLHIRPCHPD